MNELFPVRYSCLIPLLPLLGAAICGLFGAKILRGKSHWPIWIGVGLSLILSLWLLFGMFGLWRSGQDLSTTKDWYTWIEAGGFKATAGFFFDPLTAVMLCVVTGVGFFITVYSAGYMKGEAGYFRFFAYLGLFIFSMTCLVMGNNFILLYLGWEGVGLCSYLLIGYYYDRPSARDAAKKAFLVNRIGDFGFGLGIMLLFLCFGTVSYFGSGVASHTGIFELATLPLAELKKIPGVDVGWVAMTLRWAPFLLMAGAFGKSAQFPLYVWLPDAMEGPTPVSALIHAATMVTAGVYMIARCGALFAGNHAAMMTIAGIGAFTAVLSATIALRQFDLKKVFAYSTISQLGFMFVGVGCLAPVAGMFHLVTHAFFKALLFLCCGVVMHAMAGELDMRKMSGLKKILPWTDAFILVGCLALAGFPFFSGFFSKDEIVAASFVTSPVLGVVMLGAAFLTAYYTFRLYFRVFQGPLLTPLSQTHSAGHGHEEHHNHEPFVMMLPLGVLATGALVAGYLNYPLPHLFDFLRQSHSIQAFPTTAALAAAPAPEHMVTPLMIASGLISIAGVLLAYLLHLRYREADDRLALALGPITRLLEAKYWVDEIYQALIVQPLWATGEFFFRFDKWIVDILVDMVGWILQLSGYLVKFTTQRGYLQGYASAMLLGLAAILLLIFLHS